MYKIYADDILIYDSTIEDYKIVKGSISLETNKSGSFTFSLYPDHFYYNSFVRMKTVITVYRSERIVFRGRVLNEVSDYWNNKVITCEGELGFLQDTIIRPFEFEGTPEELLTFLVEEHNAQVDDFKYFNIGEITVVDPNNYIARSNSNYQSTLENLNSRLLEDSLGGYFYITHGDDGRDPTPTLNYLADFERVSSQTIEFGNNLREFSKTVNADELATAIIPLGTVIDDGLESTEDKKLTIADVNNGSDFIYSEEGVALYGWIFKVVEWEDVALASNLKAKAEAKLQELVSENITLELTAIDLHLIDPDIEPFDLNEYIRVKSKPHDFDMTLICNKLNLDILKPENDTMTIGYTYSTFTSSTIDSKKFVKSIKNIDTKIEKTNTKIEKTNTKIDNEIEKTNTKIDNEIEKTNTKIDNEIEKTIVKIEETEESILLSVATDYYKKTDVDEITKKTEAKIELAEESILLSVATDYYKKTDVDEITKKTEAKIELTEANILLSVSTQYATKSELRETVSSLIIDEESILASVATNYVTKTYHEETYSALSLEVGKISTEVSKKVGENEIGTKIEQNYESVCIAWNQNSKNIVFENGNLNIYSDEDHTIDNLLVSMTSTGDHYYYMGEKVGSIGSGEDINGDKGIVFRLDNNAGYMAWSYQLTPNATTYTAMMYFRGYEGERGMYFDTPCYLNQNVYLRDSEFVALYLNDDLRTFRRKAYGSDTTIEGAGFKSDYTNFLISCNSGELVVGYSIDLNSDIINAYGNLDLHNNDLLNESDARLKTNIVNSDVNAVELLSQIDIKSFDWIESGDHVDVGVIAQQLQAIEPCLVHEDERTGRLTIKINRFIPYLIKAIQELSGAQKQAGNTWTDTFTEAEKLDFIKNIKKR